MVSPSKTTAFSGLPKEVHVGRHGGHSAHGDEHEDNPAAFRFPDMFVVFFWGRFGMGFSEIEWDLVGRLTP